MTGSFISTSMKQICFIHFYFREGEDFNAVAPGLAFINTLREPKTLQELLEFVLLYG